jgi:RNA polymerase sigma factor (sigma-70 family)
LPVEPAAQAAEGGSMTFGARIAAGDVRAFRELFEREVAKLVRYATGALGSREDAQDAVQESFLRLWQTRARLDAESDPVRLLYTIVRNLARDRLRHRAVEQRPHPHFETPHIAQVAPLPIDERDQADELQAQVRQALETLSPRQREIVLLRWRRQLTYEQIGAELGIAPGTASAHMQRAIGQLKARLPRLRDK